jgi:hypothetical protein
VHGASFRPVEEPLPRTDRAACDGEAGGAKAWRAHIVGPWLFVYQPCWCGGPVGGLWSTLRGGVGGGSRPGRGGCGSRLVQPAQQK